MYGYDYSPTISNNSDILGIISLLVACCAAIVLYFTFLRPENAHKFEGFTKKVYDFLSFNILSLDMILKIGYLIFAVYVTIMSFSFISYNIIFFLAVLVIGNIIVRIIFESALVLLKIYQKLDIISNQFSNKKVEKIKDAKSEKINDNKTELKKYQKKEEN